MTPVDPLQPWPDSVDWHPVSDRLVIIEELQVLVTFAIALGVALAAGLWIAGWIGWTAAAAALAFAALRAVLVVRSVRAWGYAERSEDLLVRHGLLIRRLSIVPYARMQFVDVTAGPVERAFGLATVTLHTAAAASDARIPGLPGDEAARLRDKLASLGEARAEGL
jgi:membrane protein YdbS with pleckstrin-like domain